MTGRPRDPLSKRAALYLLARGACSPGDCAEIAGVSRQVVESWAKVAGIDWRKAYRDRVAREWTRAERMGAARKPSKAEQRRQLDSAVDRWRWRHGLGKG